MNPIWIAMKKEVFFSLMNLIQDGGANLGLLQ